jgi:actin-related protein
MVPSHMVSLYTLAVPTALVLDIGFKEAVLIPVVENTPVLHAYQALGLAAEAVEKYNLTQFENPANIFLGKLGTFEACWNRNAKTKSNFC